jgi:hypothetical protein
MSIRRTLLKNPVIRRNFARAISQSSGQREYTTFELLPEDLQKVGNAIAFAGYTLLLLTLLDYAFLVFPPRLLNPTWELNVIGHLLESVWAPMLGLLLIFFRMPQQKVSTRELKILSWISRLVLLVAIVYLLLVPLIISDTVRIHRDRYNQYNNLVKQQQTLLSNTQQKLNSLSEEQLTQAFSGSPLVLPNDSGVVMREKLLKEFKSKQAAERNQAAKINKENNRSLLKQSTKWGMGALLSGVLFIKIWENTKWTRNRQMI